MSIGPILQIESTKPEDTFAAGEKMGQILKGGEVIQLVGDLGAGKTAFVRGLAAGIGSKDEVASPSYTISREYRTEKNITLHHFDFYRLDEPGIMAEELRELLGDPEVIVAIEWGENVKDVLPEEHIVVTISAMDELTRSIQIAIPIPEEKE